MLDYSEDLLVMSYDNPVRMDFIEDSFIISYQYAHVLPSDIITEFQSFLTW